ncbi:MAG: glycosyltransferase [Janthinobacterium lividum]
MHNKIVLPEETASVAPEHKALASHGAAPNAILRLLDPALDPLFARPTRLGVDSAWYGHLPFAAWAVRALQPALLVELGTHAGVSYSGFCESVIASGLPTRCFAVDGWTGDEHAGFYDETVLSDLRAFHDARYGTFSRLLQMRFDEAVSRFADGSIDLLHIDGRHHFDDVAHDYRSWLPKLSPQAIVLFHDTNVRERDFGVWRFWSEVSASSPSFEFLHGHGLGVLAPGSEPPAAFDALFALGANPAATARLRDRFALLGERWEVEFQRAVETRDRQALIERADAAATLDSELGRLRVDMAQQASDAAEGRWSLQALQAQHDRLRDDLARSKADRHRLTLQTAKLEQAAIAADRERVRSAETLETALKNAAAAHQGSKESLRLVQAERDAGWERQHAFERRTAAESAARAEAWEQEHIRLRVELDARQQEVAAVRADVAIIQRSSSWRLTGPVRVVVARVRGMAVAPITQAQAPIPTSLPTPQATHDVEPELTPFLIDDALHQPDVEAATPTVPASPIDAPASIVPTSAEQRADSEFDTKPHPWRPIRRVLFVAGEPGTPGGVYRTQRNAAACAAAGYETETVDIFDVNPDNLAAADLVVLWRAAYSGHVQSMIRLAHEAGTRIAFDVDDLIVKPSLAVIEIIDGIRTTFVTEAEGRSYFQGMQRTLTSCDLCITTTEELALPLGELHPIVHVLSNTFDDATVRASRYAVRLRAEHAGDGRVRLGYAGGTRTHQKDVAEIAGALARVLQQRPEALLVLFRDGSSGEGLVLIEEFPDLLPFADRIEWRDMVPLADLPDELARFDISLCPLELGNPFCEAKSELKYFESALAGVCLVASPTGPFQRAVQDGVTGFLAATPDEWERILLRLIDHPEQRFRTARAAYHHVLWQFGPRRQAELWSQLLEGLNGGANAARASELALYRGEYRTRALPEIPDSDSLYSYDALGEARVTVGMTSYNYEAHIGEALNSVLAQTIDAIDLVVVDDGSSDGSVSLLLDWAERHRMRFNRLRILKTRRNAGLGGARNVVFDQTETPWIMVLDSDNRLVPEACARLLMALDAEPLAAFAYPRIRQFGTGEALMGEAQFDPFHLASGNYIDAMAMVAKWAWAAAGGYYVRRDAMGWEDFSLWCRLGELGQFGIAVPDELADYRVHTGSMVNAITEQDDNKRLMVEFVESRHPWLRLRMRATRKRR